MCSWAGSFNQILQQERWFKEYVLHYTNAATIINDKYVDAENADGIFSGFDPETGEYEIDKANWQYAGNAAPSSRRCTWGANDGGLEQVISRARGRQAGGGPHAAAPQLRAEHAQAALRPLHAGDGGRNLRLHQEQFMAVAEAMMANSGRERTGAIVYALGWTQHTTGVQIIRTAAMMQLLLGNVGRPGGGVMAMRGHASIQGSTDIPTLYNLLPGYIPQPESRSRHNSLGEFLRKETSRTGYWANMPKFVVSLLKAWYGDAATQENDYGFDWLPRIDGDHSQLNTFANMAKDEVDGLFLMGQNPAAGAPNSRVEPGGHEAPRLAGGARLLPAGERGVLERGAGQPRTRPDRHGDILPARRIGSREIGHAHQYAEDAAMAREGGGPSGRLPLGPVVHVEPGQAAESDVCEQHQ